MLVPKPKNYCRCGCGTVIGATKKYVSGHNLRRRPKGAVVIKGRSHIETKCTECGEKFLRRTDQINRRSLVNLCSSECKSSYQSRTRAGKILPTARKGEYRDCIVCGKEYYLSPSLVKNSAKYCSNKCKHERQRMLGIVPKNFIADNSEKNNGRYKHGKRVGGHVQKKEVRNEVIERDGGNWCLICGRPGPGLHLHRVVYGSQGGKYTVNNCVQLCPQDHMLVHQSKKTWFTPLKEYLVEPNETNRSKLTNLKSRIAR